MGFSSILLLSLGLAMDATAVSAAKGLSVPKLHARHFLLVTLFFGGFQALMPVIGWGLGESLGPFLKLSANWIAFLLLSFIGGKMLFEAFQENDASESKEAKDPFALKTMFLLAIATSIDALAMGITLPMLEAPFLLSIVSIGVVTAISSALGLYARRRLGNMLSKHLDILGGVVLIILGLKILLGY